MEGVLVRSHLETATFRMRNLLFKPQVQFILKPARDTHCLGIGVPVPVRPQRPGPQRLCEHVPVPGAAAVPGATTASACARHASSSLAVGPHVEQHLCDRGVVQTAAHA